MDSKCSVDDLEHLNNDVSLKSMYYTNIDNSENTHFDITESYFHSSTNFSNTRKVFMISLNCCSLMSKLEEIELFLSSFDDNLPTAISLQEIHKLPEFYIPKLKGYNFHYKCRQSNKGGGVGIFVRNNLMANVLDSPFIENIVESLCLKITSGDKSFILCTFYRPPSADIRLAMSAINDLFDSLGNYNLPVFISCDSNINILKDTTLVNDFLGAALSNGLVNQINIATRICPPSKTGIDQFFSNCPSKIKESGVFIDSPSDHFLLLFAQILISL